MKEPVQNNIKINRHMFIKSKTPMTIPPSIGMLLSLIAGIAIGAYGMNLKHDTAQLEADNEQVAKDNDKGAEVNVETAVMLKSNPVSDVVIKYKYKTVKVPRDLTDEEIDTLCVNRNVPADFLQLVRDKITTARKRIDNVRNKRP